MSKKNKPARRSIPLVRDESGALAAVCGNCLCYDGTRGQCKVVVIIDNKRLNMPVFPGDRCHMEELGIPVQQVRWWTENEKGMPTKGNGTVKMEYPEGFFGPDFVDPDDLHPQPGAMPGGPEVPPLNDRSPDDRPQTGGEEDRPQGLADPLEP